jgi:hypothetical protein
MALLICAALMSADKYLEPMQNVRSLLGYLITPVQWVSGLPGQLGVWAEKSAVRIVSA